MTAFSMSLIPIMALIVLGYGLRRVGFLPEQAWAGMEKLTYFVLFPALLVRTLATQNPAAVPWAPMLVVVAATLLTAALVLIGFRRILPKTSNAAFTSLFQGGVRFNTYIALAVAQGLFGAAGLALGSVTAGFMIVLINLMCISVFALWGKASLNGGVAFMREVFGNPLIIACGIGWFLCLTGIGLPAISADVFEIVGRAALPFGLLAVGAALKPEMVRGHAWSIALSSFVQFGLKPLTALVVILQTSLTGITAAVLFVFFITPTAPSGYILARQLGGDTETMASIITFQTLLAFMVMPFWGMFLMDWFQY